MGTVEWSEASMILLRSPRSKAATVWVWSGCMNSLHLLQNLTSLKSRGWVTRATDHVNRVDRCQLRLPMFFSRQRSLKGCPETTVQWATADQWNIHGRKNTAGPTRSTNSTSSPLKMQKFRSLAAWHSCSCSGWLEQQQNWYHVAQASSWCKVTASNKINHTEKKHQTNRHSQQLIALVLLASQNFSGKNRSYCLQASFRFY